MSHFRCRFLFIVVASVLVSACATQTQNQNPSPNSSPNQDQDLNLEWEENPVDPWEGFNRSMFAFNDGVDTYFLKPVAKGYRAITPDPVENSVSNVFGNLLEIRNVINDVLQWKWGKAGNDSGRFLINSTIGIAGLFDVAAKMGLERNDGEDFGQTLATWGVGSGPYLVLPLFGPSNVRDGLSFPIDAFSDPIRYIDHVPTRNSINGVQLISTRAGLLQAESLISGDKYVFFRDAFLQRREYLILDGEVEDDFGEDFEDYDEDY
ncbi:VacJ family lipoprotein [Exilibacterium tricleocarpae]|uniref:VacJ family lipoprotein n=1 Tax=Exilibacterium tricleocarpae TaxID=2591008 RepID=A0A545TNA8_9GAMM|nr:VacJ family lipoprotein [Exilibacterium tricleocarpae]TQV78705.1 VacJ family lipoprotein [Exilibacterium tricleocarpae]